jgi:hypothetical protein
MNMKCFCYNTIFSPLIWHIFQSDSNLSIKICYYNVLQYIKYAFKSAYKIEKIGIPKESHKRQNIKCCRFVLIEPNHRPRPLVSA